MAENNGAAVTTIDSLMNIIKQTGRSELTALSTSLAADPRVVEKWAKILEDNGLVRITYVTGRMFIEPIAITTDHTTLLSNKVAVSEAQLERELGRQEAELEKFASMLEKLSITTANMETLLMKSLPPSVKENINEISKTYETIKSQNSRAQLMRKSTLEEFENLNKKISDMIPKLEYMMSQKPVEAADQNIAKMRESANKANEIRGMVEEINKNKEAAFHEMRQSLEAELRDLNAKVDKAAKDIEIQMKAYSNEIKTGVSQVSENAAAVRSTAKEVEGLKKEQERIRKSLIDARYAFAREYEKVNEELRRAQARLQEESSKLDASLEETKAQLPDPIKMGQSLSQTKTQLMKATEDMTKLSAQLAEQKAELDSFGPLITKLAASISEMENTIKSGLPQSASQHMAAVEAAYKAIDENSKKAEQLRANMDKQFDESNKKLNDIISKLDSYASESAASSVQEKIAQINQGLKKMQDIRRSLDQVSKDKEASLNQIKANFTAQMKGIAQQMDEVKKQMDQQVRVYNDEIRASMKELSKSAGATKDITRKLEEFRKNQQNAISALSEMKSKFDDKYNVVINDITKGEMLIKADSSSIYETLNDIKAKMGEPLKIQSAISDVRVGIQDTKGELAAVRADLNQMMKQVASLKRSSNVSMERQLEILNDIMAKTATTDLKIAGIRGNVGDSAVKLMTITGTEQKKPKPDDAKKKGHEAGNSVVKH
jgi:DNA repair exonuclease SbcCD ATPase subunit